MSRFIGFLIGVLYMDWIFHSRHVYAFELAATTTAERLGALAFIGLGTILFFIFCAKFFLASFFHGVLAAAGFFASFDIVVIHWIFQLHRLTAGPEANVIEPILVVVGIILFIYAIKRERGLVQPSVEES
ncbi:hypothetical protein J2S74_000804 [Evansella vedderi]|uniref:Uncharacterized protein n=1 Tax=Evansella vedderi TaxID=38282 RepID=A0ABT9ZQB5_9BACI|nr:hypothetical protein [Evansella vedderi]MDQ0253432.1 hypothetical protein [Evansella vedderi]